MKTHVAITLVKASHLLYEVARMLCPTLPAMGGSTVFHTEPWTTLEDDGVRFLVTNPFRHSKRVCSITRGPTFTTVHLRGNLAFLLPNHLENHKKAMTNRDVFGDMLGA